MALEKNLNYNVTYVNTSRENIKVYKSLVPYHEKDLNPTAGGKRIGTIYPGEYYVYIGKLTKEETEKKRNGYATWVKIAFNDGNGRVKRGYIETYDSIPFGEGYGESSWVRKQEPYHYFRTDGKNLIRNRPKECDGKDLYVFELSYNSSYRDKDGKHCGKLKAGTLVGLKNSNMGEKYQDYILVYRIKPRGEGWKKIEERSYGWVQMQLDEGSQPSDRNLV